MSVEAGAPKHKRNNQRTEFDKNEEEADGIGVASNSCTPARDHASTADKGTHGVGGSNPPLVVLAECRAIPPAQIANIATPKPSKSFHITAVLKRKSRYD